MILVDLRQGSPAWHAWRQAGLGGSDAAAILGVSPHKSARRLWEERTGRAEREEQTFAMRRGLRLEPLARRLYEKKSGRTMRPVCVQHDELPWLRASLDGMDLWGARVLEIKCPHIDNHRAALSGELAPEFEAQVQHQLAATGAELCDFVSYSEHRLFGPEEQMAIVPVLPDPEYIRELLWAEWCFLGSVRFNHWPEAKKKPSEPKEAREIVPLGRAI